MKAGTFLACVCIFVVFITSSVLANSNNLEASQQPQSDSINRIVITESVSFAAHGVVQESIEKRDFNRIKWRRVAQNFGNGFDPQEGIFTAPVPGNYMFQVVLGHPISRKPFKTKTTCLHLNFVKGRSSGYDDHHISAACFEEGAPGTVNAIVQLKAGDSVAAFLYGRYTISKHKWSVAYESFNGRLLDNVHQ